MREIKEIKEKIAIKNMSDNHLINSFNMLKRQLDKDPGIFSGGNSDGAEMAIECENRHNNFIREGLNNGIEALEKEISLRKLLIK